MPSAHSSERLPAPATAALDDTPLGEAEVPSAESSRSSQEGWDLHHTTTAAAQPPPVAAPSEHATQASASGDLEGRVLVERLVRRLFGRDVQGTFIGRYQLLGTLGSGGMGVVLTALDRELQRQVALKVVHEHLLDAPHYRTRMLREAQAMARLSHPNVVQVYEVGEHEERVFIAMELVPGCTMREWLARERRSWRVVVDKYLEAGRGLAAAHRVGLVHRDFKPDNILVGHDGRVRVTDFGVAQLDPIALPLPSSSSTDGGSHALAEGVTRAGAMVGTASYMSPEQLDGKPLDARSDLFAYCIALHEGLYGERPFEGESLPRLILNVSQGRTRPAPADADVPPRIRRILLRGLAVDPAKRYSSMDAILAELDDELEVLLGHRVRGPGPSVAQAQALQRAGYVLQHPIREEVDVLWVRGIEHATGRPVVLELLRAEPPSASALARLRREHELLLRFDHPGVVRPEALVRCGDGQALVLGDPDGISLRALVGSPLGDDLTFVLRLALSLVQVLQVLHAAGVVHGGIHPDALVVDLRSRRVVITDLTSAAREGEGALPLVPRYAAPEQLDGGDPDHRTDYHALGIVLYELLTGQLPFEDVPPASPGAALPRRQPVAPHTLRDAIPPALSELVLRLLHDDPDARYQSARGLRADLQHCLGALEGTGLVPAFALGTEDVSEHFQIPDQLFGRTLEQRRLWEAYERIDEACTELVLVSGPSGIGKTSLVRELGARVADDGGRLISGKLDQVGRDTPHGSLVQAFTELFERLATEPDELRERWRERLHQALGDNLGVIAAMIPAIAGLVGALPPVPALPPNEAAHRFRDSFRKLLAVLARPEHPLVVFLDDLQWSDPSTLRLMGSLAADPELSHMLWVGAYRDDEVDEQHPLNATIRAFEADGALFSRIELHPLSIEALGELVGCTLGAPPEQVDGLVRLVHTKAEGNPFFACALLQSLHQQRLVSFDPALEQWSWDLGAIDSAQVSDDVVELMTATLVRLPDDAQRVLRIGACVGNVFHPAAVAHVMGRPEDAVADALQAATARGLIRGLDGGRHTFAHDRIQQAAHAALGEDERTRIHLTVGRWLLSIRGASGETLFTTANHLAAGLPLVESDDERDRIGELMVEAGHRAKQSNAYAASVRYFRQALALLPDNAWSGPRFLACFELHKALMEVEYLGQNPEGSSALFGPLMQHARSDEQRAEIYELRATLESSMGHHATAMDLAARGLAILGQRMPSRGSRVRVLLELLRVKRLMAGRSADELDALPEVTDPRVRLMMRLLVVYSTAGYFVDSTLLSVGMMLITRLSLRHGVTDTSAFGFAGFAMVLAGALDQYQDASDLGRLALRLNERFDNASLDAKLEVINGMFLVPWVSPFPQVRAQLDRGLKAGLHNGDIAYASYSATTCSTVYALEGVPLPQTIAMTKERLPWVRKTLDDDMASIVVAVQRMSLCFTGQTLAPPSFSSADWNEAEYVQSLSDERTPLAMYYHRLAKLVTSYHFRCLKGIPQLLSELHPRLDAAFGNPTRVDVFFYECMASALLYREAGVWERRRLRGAMRAGLVRLRRWAASCPASYEARYLLALAEYERVVRGRPDPMPLYTRAIQAARKVDAFHIEGLGLELAADHSVSSGHDLVVPAYLDQACAAFERWGATAKVRFLRERFAAFVLPALPEGSGPTP